ncbi:MAG TPA: replication initiator protein A [Longimicrobiaceae bacterium]|nr:replication initiator protein A [Longimicrobiaceae bacterium]
MSLAARRRAATRTVLLDRSLEALPLFRLSDSADEGAVSVVTDTGGRWRVLPAPGDRLPGTFDQDVYVELMRRYQEAGEPADGVVTFTLHAFLRSMGRRVDGRTYDQLRGALTRLERTVLESQGAYYSASAGRCIDVRFALLAAVLIERRRVVDREQLQLFSAVRTAEPGEARVVVAPQLRENLAAGHTAVLAPGRYLSLPSPVARRLYRLIEVARARDMVTWRISLDRLRELLPLSQRYPSHLQRVLQPAHEMLVDAGLVRDAAIRQQGREWCVDYIVAPRAS